MCDQDEYCMRRFAISFAVYLKQLFLKNSMKRFDDIRAVYANMQQIFYVPLNILSDLKEIVFKCIHSTVFKEPRRKQT